jgi:hypothetical protein
MAPAFDRPTIGSVDDFFACYLRHFREPAWPVVDRKPRPPVGDPSAWIFRGLQDPEGEMKTTLERACTQYLEGLDYAGRIERELLKDFRRRYAIYATTPPPREDRIVEWLALMQHHGAPTRLLDWTYSFFVAAFFAVSQSPGDSYIWALRIDRLNRQVEDRFHRGDPRVYRALRAFVRRRTQANFDAAFNRGKDFAYAVSPFHLNDRLTIQQGVFVCPGNPGRPFMENLEAVRLPREDSFKICIRRSCRRDILLALHKMNIHSATLFPGFDGFAESLNTKMLLLAYRPSTMEE